MSTRRLRTQVAIVGAGPAGLTLGHLLARDGIDSVIVERQTQDYVEARVRAGVLESTSVELLDELELAGRLKKEGLVHAGVQVQFRGQRMRIDLAALTGGRTITIYGQQEVVKDLIAARQRAGSPLSFSVEDVRLHGIDTDEPVVQYRDDRGEMVIECDFVAGCDGSHGVSRPAVLRRSCEVYDREHPFAWLGILAEASPSSDELVYAFHERGFALHSQRSPSLSRLYLQVDPDDDLANWPDQMIWDELQVRLGTAGWKLTEGPIIDKSITGMRSFVMEPMQFGRLFLAGDAVHIVPPTGAKGMNLAMADVRVLSAALADWYATGGTEHLTAYSATALRRVWRAQHFSLWMTNLFHRLPRGATFDARIQQAEQEYVMTSAAKQRTLAENYVGYRPDRDTSV